MGLEILVKVLRFQVSQTSFKCEFYFYSFPTPVRQCDCVKQEFEKFNGSLVLKFNECDLECM